jgi:hypothetical protein
MFKICTKCNLPKELTEEFFHKRSDSKDGFRNECIICRNKGQIERNIINSEKNKIYVNAYNLLHSEKRKEYMRIYNSQKIELCCLRCKNEIVVTKACVSKNTNYCPHCYKSQPIFEEFLKIWLDKNQIKYLREQNFNCIINSNFRYFDFYLPDYNFIIEINEDNHKYSKELDELKKQFILSKNINFIAINVSHKEKLTSFKHILNNVKTIIYSSN